MFIMSWNVNGIRAVIKKGFEQQIAELQPDIICLQETKAMPEQVEISLPGYSLHWHSAVKKGYSGTAIFSKIEPIRVIQGVLPEVAKNYSFIDDAQRDALTEGRVISAEYDSFFLVNVYTPNTKDDLSRLPLREHAWDPAFRDHCVALEKIKPVIFCGDLNVAHQEIDLARPKDNKGKHGFTNEERTGIQSIFDAGYLDSFRAIHGDIPGAYTWWSHWGKARENNVGWRIDYFGVSEKLTRALTEATIHPDLLGSDHCPVSITITV